MGGAPNRRDALGLFGTAGGALIWPSLPPLPPLDWPRLDGALEAPSRLDHAVLRDCAALNRSLWQAHWAAARSHVRLEPARAQLRQLTRLVGAAPTRYQRQLRALVAEIAQLVGLPSFGSDQNGAAAAAFTLGANAAQEASDDDLWASIVTRHAFLPIYDGRPDRALPLLQTAADVAARGDSGLATRYRIASLAADVHAGLGDLAACERALGQAEGVHRLPDGGNDWLRFDGALFLEERGASYVTARRPELAVPALEQALAAWPDPAVVEPAAVEALLALSDEVDRERAQVERQWALRLERARYDAARARRQYDACEPENRLVARELETRWNERLRTVAALEAEYRRAQRRGLAPLTDAEKAQLRALVGDAPALRHAAATTVEDRKRLLRCLVREAVLTRGAGARGAGGTTAIRIGWQGGAWTELRVRRPTTADHARTPDAVLERLPAGAPRLPDERLAAALNAEGYTTRRGLPWTAARVQRLRTYHRIPTGCPAMPRSGAPRGDGLLPVRAAAGRSGVAPSALSHWRTWGFLQAEQRGPGAPLWVRLTPWDAARLDGTLAAQGHGRWRLAEARRIMALTDQQIRERARRGEVVAYRARVADHWEWRLSPTDGTFPSVVTSATTE